LYSAIAAFLALLAVLAPASTLAGVESYDWAQFTSLSPPVPKDAAGNEITSANASELVLIFSTFSNPCNRDQQVIVVTEIRDQKNATIFYQEAQCRCV
jgi:hypothetical protein